MEQIFSKMEHDLLMELVEIEKDIKGVKIEKNSFNHRAVACINAVFRYVKKLETSKRKIAKMIHQFGFILNTGEYKYLEGEWIAKESIFRALDRYDSEEAWALVKDIVYATRWLECYAYKYEKETEEQSKQIKREVLKVILAAREWERKRNLLKEKEKESEEKASHSAFAVRLYEHLNQYVVGQEQLKKTLSMAVHRYLKFGDRSPVMMIGPTGSGKNYTIEKMAEFEDLKKEVVVYTYDISNITAAGFKGNDVQDIFDGFKAECAAKRKMPDRGIIYLDEIDKIIAPNTDGNGENMNAIVQHQLLSAIAGTTEIAGVKTKNILFILGGAFCKLEEMEKERKKQNAFGFGTGGETNDFLKENDATLREYLIQYGGQKEFIGRIATIVRMKKLTQEELKEILLHPKTGVLKRKRQSFMMNGLELEFKDEVIDMIAKRVYEENLGARSVVNIVEALLGTYEFDMLMQGYNKMVVHAGMFQNEQPFFRKSGKKRKCKAS